MNDLPLISIILPTYNRAELLPRAIQSVLNQTYPHWELIVWDDGSQDDTRAVVRSFGEQRIQYYYGDNRGVAFARNRAMEKATGKYIAFLDSDDIWMEEKLDLQLKAFDANPQIDVLFGDFINNLSTRGKTLRNFDAYPSQLALLTVTEGNVGLNLVDSGFVESLAGGNYIATDTVMLRPSVLDRVGGFTESLRNSEDFELWWRIALAGVQVAYLNAVLMERFKPEDSLSSPGVVGALNEIKALDMCVRAAVVHDREDLVGLLDKRYRNTWQNMITACAQAGDAAGTWRAFRKAMGYGFRPGTLRLMLEGLFQLAFNRWRGKGGHH